MTDNDSASTYSQDPLDDTWLIDAANWWSDALQLAGKRFRQRLDREAKQPPKTPPETSYTEFDNDFWAVAGPKLLNLIVGLAPLVQLDVYTFEEASAAVLRQATKRGLSHCSHACQFDLECWIDREILARVDDPVPAHLVTPERLRQITGEPR